MDQNQLISDNDSDDLNPMYEQSSLDSYKQKGFKQTHRKSFVVEVKRFMSTFPYLSQLEGFVTPEKRNRCTRWVCPCSAKVYNKSLWKWFPCNP